MLANLTYQVGWYPTSLMALHQVARDKLQRGEMANRNYAKHIMKRHSFYFEQKSVTDQRRFDFLAKMHAQSGRHQLEEDKDFVRSEIELLLPRVKAAETATKPMTFSAAAWGEAELHNFDVKRSSTDFREARVNQLRDAAMVTPEPLTRQMAEHLD